MSLSLEPRQTWTEVFPVVKDVFREGGAVAFACSALLLLLYRLLPRVRAPSAAAAPAPRADASTSLDASSLRRSASESAR